MGRPTCASSTRCAPRNLLMVRANAAELGRVGLVDALAILELIEELEPSASKRPPVAGRVRWRWRARGWHWWSSGMLWRALDALPDPAARRLLLALADPR